MAFHHLAGITAPGAPDEIEDWFASFQAWIVGTVGWTISSGAGTTDLRIWSGGEAGGLTKLFAHIWRVGIGNTIRIEVSDDGIPTHETSEAGTLDSGGVQFAWWMSGDKDSFVVVWKLGAGYRMLYAGLVMPFALAVPDETYCSIATSDIRNGSILRRHDGVWDQDDTLYEHKYMRLARADRDDGSLAIGGVYFGDNADIAGQLKHVSCEITDPGITPEDTIHTGQPGATTEWIVLRDHGGREFALRTGGILPTGRVDGSFAHASGVAANIAAWFTALRAFLAGRGWSETDLSGLTGNVEDWEFHSTGEDGTEDIWIRLLWGGGGLAVQQAVADSAYGTVGRHECLSSIALKAIHVPTQYFFSGDADCLAYTQNTAGNYVANWLGMVSAFAPNLSDSYMKVVQFINATGFVLHAHNGLWCDQSTISLNPEADWHGQNSQPNNYDGTTYLAWPVVFAEDLGGGLTWEPIGQMKYFFVSHGGGIALNDTLTVGAVVYTIFFMGAVPWALRTV